MRNTTHMPSSQITISIHTSRATLYKNTSHIVPTDHARHLHSLHNYKF